MAESRHCDIAWAAGLFEGEGCFTRKRNGGRLVVAAALSMTDEETVRRFHQVLGFGTVYSLDPPSWRDGKRKPQWRWQTGREYEFRALVELLDPYLGERRWRRAHELLNDLGTIHAEQLRIV